MIRTMFKLATAVLILVALAALPGCGGSNTPATNTPATTGHYEGDGHDHSADESAHSEGDGHDHEKEGDQK